MPPSSAPAVPPPVAGRGAFILLAVAQATLIFTIALIMVPLPRIAREFALGSAGVLTLQVAYGLPFSGLLLFGGRLADRFGGRRMFRAGLGLLGVASAGAALAPGFETLAAMRVAQGAGGALAAPAALALLRALFPAPAGFARAMAVWGGVSVLGAVAGFVSSGVLTHWLSWRWMFLIPIAVSLLGTFALPRLLPADVAGAPAQRPGLDPLGAASAALGIALTSFGLIASIAQGWHTPATYVPLAAGMLALAAFARFERRQRDPLLPPGFLRDPCRAAGLFGVFLAAAASVLVEFVLLLYLQQALGWTPLATALAFLPFAVVLLIANHLAPACIARLGAAGGASAGFVVAAAGLALLAGIGAGTTYWGGLLPGMLLLAIGISLVFCGGAVLAMTHAAPHQAGLAGGVMNTAMELGPTVGLALLMAIAALPADSVAGYAWAFGSAAAIFLSAAAATARLARRAADGRHACHSFHAS